MIRAVLICVTLLICSGIARAEEVVRLRLVRAIPLAVEGRIDHMAYDGRIGRLYVAALGNNTVEVVDTRAGKVVHTLRGLREPQGIAVSPDDNRFYVANAGDGTCRVFDLSTYQQVRSVGLGEDADNVRYDAAARRMYVGYGSGGLAAVDLATGNRVADVKLPAHPESFQLATKSSGQVFVNLPEAQAAVALVDRRTNSVIQTWHLTAAKDNFPMALDEARHRLFIGCRSPAKLLVVDTQSGSTLDAKNCVGDTDDVWYDSASGRVYVSGGEGFVSVLACSSDGRLDQVAKVATAPGARTSLFDSEGGMLYVALPHRGSQRAEIRAYSAR